MAKYAYVAKDKLGEEVTGIAAGSSIDEVVQELHGRGLAVLHVKADRGATRARSFWEKLGSLSFSIGGASTRDLALFNRQLATVLESGLPLVRGLRGLAGDAMSRTLARAVDDVSVRIEKGESLSNAMAAHPESFNKMHVSMIRAGERAGTLDKIVEQLATYLEKVDAIKTKVRAALSYPVFVLVFSIVVTLFLLLKIVPTFAEIYADLGQQLPALTLFIITASNVIRSNIVYTIAILAVALALITAALRTRPGRYAFDSFMMSMPVFGPIVRKAVMSRFARTFGILLESGLPILEGLELVRNAVGNAVIARAIDQAKKEIAAGKGITESFRATGKFPEMVLQLMATGEEAGDLDTMLLKSSDFYDRQVEASVHGLSSLIEPLMIVIVGALIGVIVVSMFLPIFYLGDAIMRGGYNF